MEEPKEIFIQLKSIVVSEPEKEEQKDDESNKEE